MFSHVMVGTSDVDRAKRFYEAVLRRLGLVMRKHEAEMVSFRAPARRVSVFDGCEAA